jgi:flagellin-like protein
MKGISTVIATLLMLLITIALSGLAYMYISGVFTTETQGITVVDIYCASGLVSMKLTNMGTNNITANGITCAQTSPAVDATCSDIDTGVIEPGQIGIINDTCGGTGTRTCIYRLTPPVGRTIQTMVQCA